MGRVLAPYGIKGWIKARSFAVEHDALLDHRSWWLAAKGRGSEWQEFQVVSARVHSDVLLAELEGLTTREAVLPWRGADVGIPRSALPRAKTGEVYWSDLVGMEVVNRTGEALGKVAGLVDTGVHPVLQVAGDDRERLIPLVPAYLDTVDQDARQIVVDWQLDY
jgi:16S rRNA processing protein RimM